MPPASRPTTPRSIASGRSSGLAIRSSRSIPTTINTSNPLVRKVVLPPRRRPHGRPPQPRSASDCRRGKARSSVDGQAAFDAPRHARSHARDGHRHRQLHDRQPLRPAPGPRLAALHEGHSALRPPRRPARQKHPRLPRARRARRHQDPDRLRADPALSAARRLVRRGPRPRGLLRRHALRRPRRDPQPALARPERVSGRHLRQRPGSGSSALGAEASRRLYREGELYRAATIARRSGARRSTSASSPTPIRTSSCTRASRSPAAAAFFSPSAPKAIFSASAKTKRPSSSPASTSCAEKIRRYLPDEAARARIAAAGQARALRDGYHNDRQVSLIVDAPRPLLTVCAQILSLISRSDPTFDLA